jgi:predicted alpha/beta-fold hydrolase
VAKQLLEKVSIPTFVVHSHEDKSVPFSHAEWSMQNIPRTTLCESGITGHFIWIGPEYSEITRQMVEFLCDRLEQKATSK